MSEPMRCCSTELLSGPLAENEGRKRVSVAEASEEYMIGAVHSSMKP
jgi:hypothetical protein